MKNQKYLQIYFREWNSRKFKRVIKKNNILESAFELEEKKGTKFLYEKLKKSFNTEIIMKYIAEKTKDKNFLILTGVGKVFPIVRTHTILNNLQNIFDHTKVLLFFPGEYTSTDLRLFGFQDNNYYRAFKIKKRRVLYYGTYGLSKKSIFRST